MRLVIHNHLPKRRRVRDARMFKDEFASRGALINKLVTWIKGESKGKTFADTRVAVHLAEMRRAYNLSPQEVETILNQVGV